MPLILAPYSEPKSNKCFPLVYQIIGYNKGIANLF